MENVLKNNLLYPVNVLKYCLKEIPKISEKTNDTKEGKIYEMLYVKRSHTHATILCWKKFYAGRHVICLGTLITMCNYR